MGDIYGFDRSLVPEYTNLEKAWKIDPSLPIKDHEVLIDVEVLNINACSFFQLYQSSNGNIEKIKEKIMKITLERGKCHNPVTGTGGIFAGKIIDMGSVFKKNRDFKIGDRVISTGSLIATPLIIDEILDIDLDYGQVFVKGRAILFLRSPMIRKIDDFPLNILMSAIDIAGNVTLVNKIVKEDDKVLVIGVGNKNGLFSALAVRDKLSDKGCLHGYIRDQGQDLSELEAIFDELNVTNAYQIKDFVDGNLHKKDYYDVIINCKSTTLTEMMSCIMIKEGGKIFLPIATSDVLNASFSAESIGKDCEIIGYRGYLTGHADYTIELLRKYRDKINIFEKIFKLKLKSSQSKEKPAVDNYIPMDDGSKKTYVCKSENIIRVIENAKRVARFDCTVLITGESGAGKEMIAKIIHRYSKRSHSPYIRINCAAIPETLMESELFGYEKGAFTGANFKGKKGLWEIAQGGIILLDEIGELPFTMQSKLLRVLQENEFFRVGGINPIPCDVRVLAITNRDLPKLIEEGKFRKDLYFRLNVFPIEVPALRNRKKDIPDLVEVFKDEYNEKFGLDKYICQDAIKRLVEYDWEGNIRELENFVQRLMIRSENKEITLKDVEDCKNEPDGAEDDEYQNFRDNFRDIRKGETYEEYMDDVERNLLQRLKERERTTRNIAEKLDISQASVVRKLNKYNLND